MLPYLMELLFNQYFLNIFGCLLLDYNLYLKVEYEHMDRFCPLIHHPIFLLPLTGLLEGRGTPQARVWIAEPGPWMVPEPMDTAEPG